MRTDSAPALGIIDRFRVLITGRPPAAWSAPPPAPPMLDVTPLVTELGKPVRKLAPAISKRAAPVLEEHSADAHARRLLISVQDSIQGPVCMYADELAEAHRELCAELLWKPRNWVSVGRELRKLLGDGKQYATVRAEDGSKHRLVVYEIPTRDAVVPLPLPSSSVARKAAPARRAA